ncbi:hypothetical protein THAOC_34379 [Thalassiosira oceanica]|uniref:Uncharacterized protein n=1 Tax=Thalassiosira oceanica TaxID=159749 RepID=K0R518_THAOC|nr:hypothetical protein THAOC_34379 [Thalassiosira oceanica]|eukprot:EJK46934.1 hypothetical protein THAOC_34379 [Thalassiosira oceanica]
MTTLAGNLLDCTEPPSRLPHVYILASPEAFLRYTLYTELHAPSAMGGLTTISTEENHVARMVSPDTSKAPAHPQQQHAQSKPEGAQRRMVNTVTPPPTAVIAVRRSSGAETYETPRKQVSATTSPASATATAPYTPFPSCSAQHSPITPQTKLAMNESPFRSSMAVLDKKLQSVQKMEIRLDHRIRTAKQRYCGEEMDDSFDSSFRAEKDSVAEDTKPIHSQVGEVSEEFNRLSPSEESITFKLDRLDESSIDPHTSLSPEAKVTHTTPESERKPSASLESSCNRSHTSCLTGSSEGPSTLEKPRQTNRVLWLDTPSAKVAFCGKLEEDCYLASGRETKPAAATYPTRPIYESGLAGKSIENDYVQDEQDRCRFRDRSEPDNFAIDEPSLDSDSSTGEEIESISPLSFSSECTVLNRVGHIVGDSSESCSSSAENISEMAFPHQANKSAASQNRARSVHAVIVGSEDDEAETTNAESSQACHRVPDSPSSESAPIREHRHETHSTEKASDRRDSSSDETEHSDEMPKRNALHEIEVQQVGAEKTHEMEREIAQHQRRTKSVDGPSEINQTRSESRTAHDKALVRNGSRYDGDRGDIRYDGDRGGVSPLSTKETELSPKAAADTGRRKHVDEVESLPQPRKSRCQQDPEKVPSPQDDETEDLRPRMDSLTATVKTEARNFDAQQGTPDVTASKDTIIIELRKQVMELSAKVHDDGITKASLNARIQELEDDLSHANKRLADEITVNHELKRLLNEASASNQNRECDLAKTHREELERVKSELESAAAATLDRRLAEASQQNEDEAVALRREMTAASEAKVDAGIARVTAELKQVHSSEVESIRASHADEIDKVKSDVMATATASHSEQTARMAAMHKEELARLKSELESSSEEALEKRVSELLIMHSSEIDSLRIQLHNSSIAQVQHVEHITASHKEEIERIRAECTVERSDAQLVQDRVGETEKHASFDAADDKTSSCAEDNELNELHSIVMVKTGMIFDLRQEIERLSCANKELLKEKDSGESLIVHLRTQLSCAVEDKCTVEGSLTELRNEVAALMAQMKEKASMACLRTEVLELSDQKAMTEVSMANLQSNMKYLIEERDKLAAKLNDVVTELEIERANQLETCSFKDLDTTASDLQSSLDVDSPRRTIREILLNSSQVSPDDIDLICDKMGRALSIISDIEGERQALKKESKQFDKVKEELDSSRKQLQDVMAVVSQSRLLLENSERENQRLTAQLNDLKRRSTDQYQLLLEKSRLEYKKLKLQLKQREDDLDRANKRNYEDANSVKSRSSDAATQTFECQTPKTLSQDRFKVRKGYLFGSTLTPTVQSSSKKSAGRKSAKYRHG